MDRAQVRPIVALATLVGALALVAAGAGLLIGAGAPFEFTTVRGATTLIYGIGLYRYDTAFLGAGTQGQDVVTLLLGMPLLALTTLSFWRGSLRGGLLLLGMLGYFLYCYATMSLAVAFNPLFPVYIAVFGASLWAFGLLFRALLPALLAASQRQPLPRRLPATFLLVSGVVTSFIWLSPVVVALATGEAPVRLDNSTTLVTTALDMAIIVPSLFLSGELIRRRNALGHLIAVPQLCLILMIGPVLVASTIMQLRAGLQFSVPEIVGPIGGFGTIALCAAVVLLSVMRHIAAEPAVPPAQTRRPLQPL